MKKLALRMIIFALYLPATAWANLDYKCLSDCKVSGEVSAVCMAKCSYEMQDTSVQNANQEQEEDPYNQFSDMESKPSTIKEHYNSIHQQNGSTYYICMPECLKNNLQYKFCEEKCSDLNLAKKPF